MLRFVLKDAGRQADFQKKALNKVAFCYSLIFKTFQFVAIVFIIHCLSILYILNIMFKFNLKLYIPYTVLLLPNL